MFLDEQFKFVSGNASRVGSSGTVKDHWYVDAQLQNITVPQNGYIFVYVSNESNFDVFFDNLQVIHKPGPILEETHYYPFGLSMAGISSKAAGGLENKYKYNGKELQHNEFSNGSGLEAYDYGARMQDLQLGVWHNIDPFAEKYLNFSPYTFDINNPLRFYDPTGMDVFDIAGGVEYTGDDAKSAFLLLSRRTKNVYVKIDADSKERREINAEDKKAQNGNWAVFAVPNLYKAVLALSPFENKSIDNLVVANHGASAKDQSWFSIYDNPTVTTDKEAINTNEISSYNKKNNDGEILTDDEKQVGLFKSLGAKVANGGNMAFVFCYTGKGKSGIKTAKELSSLMGNRFNIYLPIGYSAASFYTYTTGKAIATSGSLSGSNNPGWITTSNGTIATIFDIVLSATAENSFNVISKKPN